jgi:transposase
VFDYSPAGHGEYPRKVLAAWSGVMQADAFSGYNALYAKGRNPAPVVEAACWAHGRRDFFDLAKLAMAPIAAEIVRRIDEVFAWPIRGGYGAIHHYPRRRDRPSKGVRLFPRG